MARYNRLTTAALGAGFSFTLAYCLVPNESAKACIAFCLALASISAVIVGVRLYRPESVAGWHALATGMGLHAFGTMLWSLRDIGAPIPLLAAPVLHLAGYFCLILGTLLLTRKHLTHDDPGEWLDALVITAAIGLLGWGLVVSPIVASSDLSYGATAVALIPPVAALATLGCAAQLWAVTSRTRNRSFRMIVVAFFFLLLANLTNAAFVLGGGEWHSTFVGACRLCFFVLAGSAALHPTMAAPPTSAVDEQTTSWWRFASLTALAGTVPLGIVLYDAANNRTTNFMALTVGSSLLFTLVVIRLAVLGGALNRATQRERVLRGAGNELVQSVDIDRVREVARTAAAKILNDPEAAAWLVMDANVCNQKRHGIHEADGSRTVRILRAPHPVHEFFNVDEERFMVIVPLDTHIASSGQLVLSLRRAPSRTLSGTLVQLSDSVAHALDRLHYADASVSRRSEERLQQLLHDASDVIAVLDEDRVIRYVTPAVSRLLGVGHRTLVGHSWLQLVHDDDRHSVRNSFSHARKGRTTRSEVRLIADNGAERFVEMAISGYKDQEGSGFTVSCHDFTRRHELEEQLTHQAFHDTLTGLANRALFQDRLRLAVDRGRRSTSGFAVLFVDLDDFKNVNDSLGHAVGDSLLRTVARRLRAVVRPEDTAARLGGDEFAVLIEDFDDIAEVELVASRLVEALSGPVRIAGAELLVGASIGVAHGDGRTKDIEVIMRNADLALYEAKGAGKGRYAVFAPVMHEHALGKMQLTAEMRRGIARDEFRVHFQPLIDIVDGRIIGVEALARWEHPERGLLSPAHFVSVAEDTGLVVPLGREILEAALMQAGSWQQEMGDDLLVSVNLSGRQLMDSCIVDDVRFALQVSGVRPDTVLLEITETVLLPGEGVTLDRLRELADLGIRLYIDDFGTGYSSLSYLRQLPVRGIKLAREFVATLPGSNAETGLVRTIRDLARTLQLDDVVCEGIETPEQQQSLVDLGFRIGQGFLLARPGSAEDVTALLRAQGTLAPVVAETV